MKSKKMYFWGGIIAGTLIGASLCVGAVIWAHDIGNAQK